MKFYNLGSNKLVINDIYNTFRQYGIIDWWHSYGNWDQVRAEACVMEKTSMSVDAYGYFEKSTCFSFRTSELEVMFLLQFGEYVI